MAFPLSNAPPGQSAVPANFPSMPSVPPFPTMPPTLPPILTWPINNPEEVQDSHNTLKEVKEILLQFLESSSELGSKSNDIKRRIDVMEDMWLSGKLNTRIHQQMKELAYGLYSFTKFLRCGNEGCGLVKKIPFDFAIKNIFIIHLYIIHVSKLK